MLLPTAPPIAGRYPPPMPASVHLHRVADLFARTVRTCEIVVEGGRIAAMRETARTPPAGVLVPGFVDAHVHVESSMLPPWEFARVAMRHGTVASVSDPHEIANVLGVPGVRFMLDDIEGSPFTVWLGCPSCVPATSFETAGAALDADACAALLDDPRIRYLSEMMNWPGVLAGDAQVLAKIAAARARGKHVDGQADQAVLKQVGLTEHMVEDMYQVMAIANYEDRFVIPTTHREVVEDAYDLRGDCGFSFGNGCSGGRTELGLFGRNPRSRAKPLMEV